MTLRRDSDVMPALLDCLGASERAHASNWLHAFESEAVRDRVLGWNWRNEVNFTRRIAAEIGAELRNAWVAPDPPAPAIAAVTGEDRFCPSESSVANPGGWLSRIITVNDLARFYLNAAMPLTSDLTDAQLLALLSDIDPASDMRGRLRGRHDFCWATPTDQIAAAGTADELRDLVGTPFEVFAGAPATLRRDMEWLVEIVYSAHTPAALHRPTVVEAQGGAEFMPSEANASHGTTVNLRTGEPGVDEFVHPSFDVHLLSAPPASRGRLISDPPDEWVSTRLGAV